MLKTTKNFVLRFFLAVLLALTAFGCAYGSHIDRGDAFYAQGKYAEALAEYRKAHELAPKEQEALDKIRQTEGRLVGEAAQKADERLGAGDYLGAVKAASEIHAAVPNADATKALVSKVSTRAQEVAHEAHGRSDFATAFMLYEAVFDGLPTEQAAVQPKLRTVRTAWSKLLVERGEAAAKNNHRGDALLHFAKATQLSKDPQLGGRRDELRRALLEDFRYRVSLRPASSNDRHKASGEGLSLGRDAGIEVGPQVGKNPNATFRFSVGSPRYKTEKTTITKTARYQSGTKEVPNPFFETKQRKVTDEERRLVERQNEVTKLESDVDRYEAAVAKEGPSPNTSTGMEQNLSRAKSNLESARRRLQDQRLSVQRAKEDVARESATKEEPVYSELSYDEVSHTLIATSRIKGKITHADKRSPVIVDFVVLNEASDSTHKAYPEAEVAENPLELPSKDELTAKMWADARKGLVAAVEESFASYRKSFLTQAEGHGTPEDKLEFLMIHVVLDPAKIDPQVVNDVQNLRGIPDVGAIFKGQ